MSILYIHDLSLSFLYDEKVSQSASSHFFLIFFFYIKLYRTALHNSVHGSLSGRCCYLFMGSQSGRSNYLNTFEISGDHIICTASCDPVSYVEALVTVETRYLYKARYLGNKLDICTRLATQATMFSFMVLQYLVDHVTCSWSSSIWQIMLPVHGSLSRDHGSLSSRSCYLFMVPCPGDHFKCSKFLVWEIKTEMEVNKCQLVKSIRQRISRLQRMILTQQAPPLND